MHDQMSSTDGGIKLFNVFGIVVAVFANDGEGVVFVGRGGDDEAGAETFVSRFFGGSGSRW